MFDDLFTSMGYVDPVIKPVPKRKKIILDYPDLEIDDDIPVLIGTKQEQKEEEFLFPEFAEAVSLTTTNSDNSPTNSNNDLIKIDIEDLFKSEGITSINGKPIRFGNKNLRPANASYGVKNSNHKKRDPHTGNAMARDISIAGGTPLDYTEFRRILISNPRIVEYLHLKGWGILNELTPAMLAKTNGTGPHFHFGPDTSAKRTLAAWLKNPNLSITQGI